MVQNSSEQLLSLEQLNSTLGSYVTEDEFQQCLEEVKSLKPKVGKFWQGTEVERGIYIVISGKVRLLDDPGELIATLLPGKSFGELTLFPETDFKPYGARASVDLHVCFIPATVLSPLIAKYPAIRECLWNKACSREPNPDSLVEDSNKPLMTAADLSDKHISTSNTTQKASKKISKAYFPTPSQRVGHLWQRVTRRYPVKQGWNCWRN